ncbi:hypothetical protein BJ322DRAFT_982843, partial [Thelephora terrestris]
DVRAYWESVPGGEKWVSMVTSYLILETMPPLKGVSTRLAVASRPQELRRWLTNGKCSLDRTPAVVDANTYGTEWVKWWTPAQPQEREVRKWPFPRSSNSDACWRKFPANGKDGLFTAVMALAWW